MRPRNRISQQCSNMRTLRRNSSSMSVVMLSVARADGSYTAR